ncbi:hypothetical protein SCFA_590031 [anaerobic digester metagenome]|uniref:Uncharacterized protein n=1 Tax=anaerobic digester metagenome TaxID=1263854 RepID=A0A485M480_9ZZZZ
MGIAVKVCYDFPQARRENSSSRDPHHFFWLSSNSSGAMSGYSAPCCTLVWGAVL